MRRHGAAGGDGPLLCLPLDKELRTAADATNPGVFPGVRPSIIRCQSLDAGSRFEIDFVQLFALLLFSFDTLGTDALGRRPYAAQEERETQTE